jgi:hypothetical protein
MKIVTLPSVACQKCRQDNQVEFHESITSHDRHLRDKLISGQLWKWRCRHCTHENRTLYPLLYHDMRVWCMIYYLDRGITEDPNIIAQMVPAPDQLTALRRFNSTYRFRLCRTLDDFMEKIRILDAGLDDRTVEYLKLHRAKDMKTQGPAAVNGRFDRLTDGETKTLGFGPPSQPLEIPLSTYSDALAKIKKRLGDETDPQSGFIIVDQSYIEERFREPVPKVKDTSAPREAAATDMGSVVFGKSWRFDEARKSWWRFW